LNDCLVLFILDTKQNDIIQSPLASVKLQWHCIACSLLPAQAFLVLVLETYRKCPGL